MASYTISKWTMPDGTVLELKDKVAREALAGALHFVGITSTNLTDGSAFTLIEINGDEIEVQNGYLVIHGNREFVYSETDGRWHELGNVADLGALALKDDATGVYTPTGTVSKPSFVGQNIDYTPTGTVSSPAILVNPDMASASMPEMDFTFDSQTHHLTIDWSGGGFTKNNQTTRQMNVATDVTAQLEESPEFVGDETVLQIEGEVTRPTFTGDIASITVE